MSRESPNCAVANRLNESFIAGDLEGIYALLDPAVEWEFEVRSCQLMEIENGRIVRLRIYQDTAQMVDAWRS